MYAKLLLARMKGIRVRETISAGSEWCGTLQSSLARVERFSHPCRKPIEILQNLQPGSKGTGDKLKLLISGAGSRAYETFLAQSCGLPSLKEAKRIDQIVVLS